MRPCLHVYYDNQSVCMFGREREASPSQLHHMGAAELQFKAAEGYLFSKQAAKVGSLMIGR